MRVRFSLIASFAFIVARLVAHAHAQYAELESHFTRVQLTSIDAEDRRLNLSIDGRTVVIALVKNDIRSADFRAQVTSETGARATDKTDPDTYIRNVDGEPSSGARMYRRGSELPCQQAALSSSSLEPRVMSPFQIPTSVSRSEKKGEAGKPLPLLCSRIADFTSATHRRRGTYSLPSCPSSTGIAAGPFDPYRQKG